MYRVLTKSMFICVWLFIRFRTCTCGSIFAPGRRVITQFCRGLLWRKIMHPFSASQDHPFLVPGHAWCVPIIHVPPSSFHMSIFFLLLAMLSIAKQGSSLSWQFPPSFSFLAHRLATVWHILKERLKLIFKMMWFFMPWNSSGQP